MMMMMMKLLIADYCYHLKKLQIILNRIHFMNNLKINYNNQARAANCFLITEKHHFSSL